MYNYSVFTKKAEPVELFDFPGISLDLNQTANIELPQNLQDAGVSVSQKQKPEQQILAPEVLNDSSNIIAHLILMGFVVNVGFKVAMLGVETNREVQVKVTKNAITGGNKSVLLPNDQNK